MVESKTIGDPAFTKEIRPTGEPAEISESERPMLECLPTSSDHQSPKSTSGTGHIVYVRRKVEPEFGKTSFSSNLSDAIVCSHERKLSDQGGKTEEKMKAAATCISDSPSIHTISASAVSAKHRVAPSHGKSNNISSAANVSHVHVNSANSLLDTPKKANAKHWEERYRQLQNVLKTVDQSDHEDYMQILRSLSSVELSRHAVELEKRSIWLSVEEAKEMQRVRLLDVLGKNRGT